MSKKRLLCVEDREEICKLISTILEKYEVVSAHTVADAIHLANCEKFDLYLFDYDLPDSTGLELAMLVKNFDPMTPIIFVTGSHLMTEEKALEIGARGLIRKGSNNFVGDLENKVSQALSVIPDFNLTDQKL